MPYAPVSRAEALCLAAEECVCVIACLKSNRPQRPAPTSEAGGALQSVRAARASAESSRATPAASAPTAQGGLARRLARRAQTGFGENKSRLSASIYSCQRSRVLKDLAKTTMQLREESSEEHAPPRSTWSFCVSELWQVVDGEPDAAAGGPGVGAGHDTARARVYLPLDTVYLF